jgi:hypothetical protein
MHQALEAAEQVKDHSHPTIFAGDVNSKHDGLPARVLRARAGLTLSDPQAGIDQILFRPGTFVDAQVLSVKQVLTEAVDLGDESRALSDHPGVLADIQLTQCEDRCQPATLGDKIDRLEAEVLPLIDAELDSRSTKMTRDLILALSLPMVGMVLVSWRRRRLGGCACLRSRAAALMLVFAAGWFAYLYTSFGPAHVAGLLGIRGRLAAAAIDQGRTASTTILSRSGS